MTLRVVTFGGLRVFRERRELTDLPSQRLRCALLVYLGVERRATRDAIMGVLWPERAPDRARHSLSQTLYELRRDVGEDLLDVHGEFVSATGNLDVDAHGMGRLLEAGAPADALALYGGPFLEGVRLADTVPFESWVDRQRARLARLHRQARGQAVDRARAAGDLETAVTLARGWVEHDALDDEGQHVLIELLALAGQRTRALEQYERYEELLARELEVEPLEQTKGLVERIRAGEGLGHVLAQDEGDGAASPPSPPAGLEEDPGAWTEAQLADAVAPDLEIVQPLGQGSMARVYLAREAPLRRLVALKVLRPGLAEERTARLRFEREAQSAARMVHPNVATVFRVGSFAGGVPYIVMQYVEGRTLAAALDAAGRLEVADARRILGEVASGLAAAHRRRIVHRDVRAENVMLEDRSGTALLMDFGFAAMLASGDPSSPRLTRTGEIVGNPLYMSPEQMEGGAVTPESDVFSLGVLAYVLLTTGIGPGVRDSLGTAQLRGRGVRISELRGDVDADLDDLVHRCLAEDPTHRPTAADVARRLREPAPPTLPAAGAAAPSPTPAEAPGEGLFPALLRRRLPQLAAGYVAAAWLGTEAIDRLVGRDVLPPRAYPVALAFALVAFPAVLVLSWFHGEPGARRVPRLEVWLLVGLALVWIVATAIILAR